MNWRWLVANVAVCTIASIILIFSPLSQKNAAIPNGHTTYPQNGHTDSPTTKPSENNNKDSYNKSDQTTDNDQKAALHRQETYIVGGLVINFQFSSFCAKPILIATKTEFSAKCPPELAELETAFFAGFLTARLVTLIAPLSVLLVRRVEEETT
jgi:hypothetical protein